MSGETVVIGAGLAGMTAALRLAHAGRTPMLLETRNRPGGRAISFDDVRSELVLDNCQHVLMGCCTNLIALFEQLGVADRIQWTRCLHWMRPDGGVDVVGECRLPAPAHQLLDVLRMRLLTRREKFRLARTMFRMVRLGRRGHARWRGKTFSAFLDACRETQRVRDLFWSPVVVSACNLDIHEVAATHALHVFQDAFLASRRAGRIGIPSVPLSELYEPLGERLEKAGGEMRTGVSVNRIEVSHGKVAAVHTRDETIACDTVVCTVPWNRVAAMVDGTDSRLVSLECLSHSPILGVHLLVDRPVMHRSHLVLAGRGVHWLFNKGPLPDGSGQHLHAVISAADGWMDLSQSAIEAKILAELGDVLPALRTAEIRHIRPVKERQATFRATPAAEAIRPQAAPGEGDVQGLHLAGDWCRTGWPATMEGAVISGHLAAQSVLGADAEGPAVDLPPARLPRLLGLRR